MTWDWDKLQEKRQRQQGQRPSRPLFGDTDDSDTQDEPRRARRSPFGDGGNDIDMLRYAGVGVAMGNATDDVKQVADYVTADVDADGVARALEHFGVI